MNSLHSSLVPKSIRRVGIPRLRQAGVLLVGSVVFALAASPTMAMRHLRLLRSFPAADTVLTRAPDAVRLWWSEPAELSLTKVSLTNAKGVSVKLSAVTRDSTKGAPVVARIGVNLPGGRYNVSWRTMSKDGHVMKGVFAFRVSATTPSK